MMNRHMKLLGFHRNRKGKIMLEKIKVALQEFKDTYEGATKIYKEARKDLHDNYRGNMFTVKLTEAKDLYENTLQSARIDNLAVCVGIIDSVREQAKAIISVPVSPEFPATLEAIKNIKNPSDAELDGIIGNFKNNYVAYRAICDAIGGTAKGYTTVTYDDILKYCDVLENMLRNCFYSYSVSDYNYRVLLEGDVLDGYDALFTTFTEGHFDEIVSLEDSSKEGE